MNEISPWNIPICRWFFMIFLLLCATAREGKTPMICLFHIPMQKTHVSPINPKISWRVQPRRQSFARRKSWKSRTATCPAGTMISWSDVGIDLKKNIRIRFAKKSVLCSLQRIKHPNQINYIYIHRWEMVIQTFFPASLIRFISWLTVPYLITRI
jgi:hypothetical protein